MKNPKLFLSFRSGEDEVPSHQAAHAARAQGEHGVQDMARDTIGAKEASEAEAAARAGLRVLLRVDEGAAQTTALPRHGEERWRRARHDVYTAVVQKQGESGTSSLDCGDK